MSGLGTIIKRAARAVGIPVITDAEYRAIMEARAVRSVQKADAAKKANDVIGQYLHGLNADSMQEWIKKGQADE